MRSLLAYYAEAVMSAAAGGRGAGCARGCSGRGDCLNGTCLCEIRYAGSECTAPNMPYHACIGGIFLLVSFVCAVQLVLCIASEYRRLKAPSIVRACKVTTQKMLYVVAFLASLIRGAYFVSPSAFQEGWATSLLSAYYPLLMSGSSLIVCFWAEVFHLRDIRWERPRFLSKSFLAFVTFNFLTYSLLAAEVVTTNVADTSPEQKIFYQHIFNGCYAVLLFIVVVFFLIYGVEVYFKVRGEFLKETKVCTIVLPRPGPSSAHDDEARHTLVAKQGIVTDASDGEGSADRRSVDKSQLQQSRLGLVSQGCMLLLISGFLASETLGELWKAKVPVGSRNWHDLVFRLAEIGVALWFPCVLWNSMSPERLWILNPRRLLAKQIPDDGPPPVLEKLSEYQRKLQQLAWYIGVAYVEWRCRIYRVVCVFLRVRSTNTDTVAGEITNETAQHVVECNEKVVRDVETESLVGSVGSRDCYICYDSARPEPLIKPCRCTGDVSSVHHDCLRRWLMESASNSEELKCRVCNSPYLVQQTDRVEWERGFRASDWLRTAACVCALCLCGAAAALLARLAAGAVPRALAAGAALLLCYVAVRCLGSSTVMAYKRAKVSSLKILAEPETKEQVSTISKTIMVDMAAKPEKQ